MLCNVETTSTSSPRAPQGEISGDSEVTGPSDVREAAEPVDMAETKRAAEATWKIGAPEAEEMTNAMKNVAVEAPEATGVTEIMGVAEATGIAGVVGVAGVAQA